VRVPPLGKGGLTAFMCAGCWARVSAFGTVILSVLGAVHGRCARDCGSFIASQMSGGGDIGRCARTREQRGESIDIKQGQLRGVGGRSVQVRGMLGGGVQLWQWRLSGLVCRGGRVRWVLSGGAGLWQEQLGGGGRLGVQVRGVLGGCVGVRKRQAGSVGGCSAQMRGGLSERAGVLQRCLGGVGGRSGLEPEGLGGGVAVGQRPFGGNGTQCRERVKVWASVLVLEKGSLAFRMVVYCICDAFSRCMIFLGGLPLPGGVNLPHLCASTAVMAFQAARRVGQVVRRGCETAALLIVVKHLGPGLRHIGAQVAQDSVGTLV